SDFGFQGPGAGDNFSFHTLPVSEFLSADGERFRRSSAENGGAVEGPDQLAFVNGVVRPGIRQTRGAEELRAGVALRPGGVDVCGGGLSRDYGAGRAGGVGVLA